MLSSAWRMGRANAAVLPLPVSAKPMMSRPCVNLTLGVRGGGEEGEKGSKNGNILLTKQRMWNRFSLNLRGRAVLHRLACSAERFVEALKGEWEIWWLFRIFTGADIPCLCVCVIFNKENNRERESVCVCVCVSGWECEFVYFFVFSSFLIES